jgi:hypothetical protein
MAGRSNKASTLFPQDRERVDEFDRLLKRHVSAVRDYTQAFHERWAGKGITTLKGAGWAVRPFLVPAARLRFVAAAFSSAMTRLRTAMMTRAAVPGAIADALPFAPDFEQQIDVAAGAGSLACMAYFRPDGFLFEDRFVLSEINYGNGIIISGSYTEMVADYWRRHPVIGRLGWDVDRLHPRPFLQYVATARRFARPSERPRIALLSHADEWRAVQQFPKRVMEQMRFARSVFRRAGLRARFVTHNDIALDRRGVPRFVDDGARIDLVMFVTVGTTFMDEPKTAAERVLRGQLSKARFGDVWILKPLAGLLMDKGALPLLGTLRCSQRMTDGFRFRIAATEYPFGRRAARYAERRKDWVIKRAFDGKDTHPGIARDARRWRTIVADAVADKTYVAQRYVSLPRADVPVFVDDRHLEWVPSRTETSAFVFDGVFGGAGIRYAPDAEGHVMTDFPAGYGYSTAFAV